ncbi:hypothetical protein D3C80_1692880 [compost metagenome]
MLVAVGATHLDTQLGGGLQVQGGIAHAAGEQQLEIGQAAQQALVEHRAFTHHADHFEALQALGKGVAVSGIVVEKRHLADTVQYRPIDHATCHILPIVYDCYLHRHGTPRQGVGLSSQPNRALWNRSGSSICGACPRLGNSTRVERGISPATCLPSTS